MIEGVDDGKVRMLPAWLYWCAWAAIAIGIVLRFANLEHKVFWQDEAYAAMHVTGHFDRSELRPLFDGRVHPIADLQRLQQRERGRGAASTVRAIALEDSDQGALYYVIERAAVGALGTSFAAYRFAGAFIGALAIFAAFLLAAELFGSRAVGTLFAAIVALSPFQVLYAHEARGYTLTIFMTLLVSWLLLVALRKRSATMWAAYALCAALGLYTNEILALVLVSHVLYVIAARREERGSLLSCIAAAAAAFILFAPWMLVIYGNRALVSAEVGWGQQAYPAKIFLEKWLFNASAQFFDLAWIDLQFAAVGAVILALCGYATWYMIRRARTEQWSFVVILGAVTALVFAGRDAVQHSHWSTTARYLIPAWLALQLTLAYFLGTVAAYGTRRQASRLWAAVAAVLLVFEAWSSVVNTRADSWYNNELSAPTPALAAAINQAQHPLLVGEHNWGFYLDIAPYLKSDVSVQLFRDSGDAHVASTGYRTVFVASPSPFFVGELERQGFRLREVYAYRSASSAYEEAHAELQSADPKRKLATVSRTIASYPNQLYVLEAR